MWCYASCGLLKCHVAVGHVVDADVKSRGSERQRPRQQHSMALKGHSICHLVPDGVAEVKLHAGDAISQVVHRGRRQNDHVMVVGLAVGDC